MKALVVTMLLACALASAQTQQQKTAVPADDYSGMYSFLQEGEFVQISLEDDNRVTGFISSFADSDKTGFVDYFFEKAELRNRDIRFSTRKVRGTWFEFKGTIERGPGQTRDAEAYYVIKGTLTQSTSDAKGLVTAKESEVTLRSFPRDIEDEPKDKASDSSR